MTTNRSWSRVNDLALGFGVARYTFGNEPHVDVLWRLQITGFPGTKLAEFDADVRDLRKIATWCEQAIKILQTDGERSLPNGQRGGET